MLLVYFLLFGFDIPLKKDIALDVNKIEFLFNT